MINSERYVKFLKQRFIPGLRKKGIICFTFGSNIMDPHLCGSAPVARTDIWRHIRFPEDTLHMATALTRFKSVRLLFMRLLERYSVQTMSNFFK
jgi:hypothetical protein